MENRVGVREELTRLVVHGTLHVLGYTHSEGSDRTTGEMWRRQEEIVAAIV
jgi:ssRNA-specific RNase YbeY (16S rRNA maturation enzyme)